MAAGQDGRVGGQHAVHVGPDLDLFGVDARAHDGGGVVAAAAAERGGDAVLGGGDEAAHHDHAFARPAAEWSSPGARRSPGKLGAACVWRLSVIITSRESTCSACMPKWRNAERHDVAGEPLAVAGDGVDGARREFAEHGEPFDQFGQLLEMLVEEAVEIGAVARAGRPGAPRASGSRADREAGGCTPRACPRWRRRRWRAACWWSSPWRRPPRRDGALRGRCTMPATRSMAAADSTEVPPNFMTIISRASLPSASARHSVRPRRPRRGWCCGSARRTCNPAPGRGAGVPRRPPCRARVPRPCAAADGWPRSM